MLINLCLCLKSTGLQRLIMKKNIIYAFIIAVTVISCQNKPKFQTEIPIFKGKMECKSSKISNEDLGLIEGIHCNDSLIMTLDFHDGMSYSLFDNANGKCIKRFGETGHGNMEIPVGCMGSIYNGMFYAFDDELHIIASYKLDSQESARASEIIKYQIDGAQISQIVPINNHLFVAMGTYKNHYQYIVFDDKNNVSGYAFDIYNKDDEHLDEYHKFLSNQGCLVRHPHKNLFVGAIRYSANIDFFAVENGKIREIQSIRQHNPILKSINVMGMRRVLPDDNTINGYIDLCATDEYVFALYSDVPLKSDSYCSKTILVFDWNGNIVGKIPMNNDVYYVAANKSCLFTVEKDKEGHFVIVEYCGI